MSHESLVKKNKKSKKRPLFVFPESVTRDGRLLLSVETRVMLTYADVCGRMLKQPSSLISGDLSNADAC